MIENHKLVRAAVAAASLAAIVAFAAPATAAPSAFGIRGGLTSDADAVFFGGHAAIHFRGAPRLRLEPSLELGIGDEGVDFFFLRFNFNFKYLIPLGRRQAVYPLFGPGLSYVNSDVGDDTGAGLNLGGGVSLYGISFDLAFGIEELPDLTFTIGYTFW